ncbi:hypothetical protein MATL_G00125980 [Megalops atlanticus]|uniref:XK-related protein n=1 Tax=Megalops atlanticus TaxID=7932 RepID=A0A9D3PZT1_MEGAT|nr:hypothetical protein MATL_G00125980 [Megalops atlanticus]
MECRGIFKYSCLDFVFTVVGVCAYLFDVGSDLWVAVEFYLHGDFFWFGLVVSFMALPSLVVQMFSWFWFKYDRELEGFKAQTSAEKIVFGGEGRLKLSLLHAFQLGFLLRHISAVEQGFWVWWLGSQAMEYVVYVTHDLSMLRLIEAFCESAPQLTLMLYIMLRTNQARTVQYVSVVASATSIASSVAMYHRSLRSFLPDKDKQGWGSSVVYFLWNLLLITPRMAALALSASSFPCCIAVHFLFLWVPLFLWACLQRTHFMDSTGGEFLYRAVVALIWYFSWFNVAEGRTRWRSVIYHSFMVADGGILLATWWWNRDAELTRSYALPVVAALPSAYLLGLLLKGLYYSCFHPKLWAPPVQVEEDVPDGQVAFRSLPPRTAPPSQLRNKRMASLANIFYSAVPPLPHICLENGNASNGVI